MDDFLKDLNKWKSTRLNDDGEQQDCMQPAAAQESSTTDKNMPGSSALQEFE